MVFTLVGSARCSFICTLWASCFYRIIREVFDNSNGCTALMVRQNQSGPFNLFSFKVGFTYLEKDGNHFLACS